MSKNFALQFLMEVAGVAGSITALSAVASKTKELKDKTDELSNTQKKLEDMSKLHKNFQNMNKEYANAVKQLAKLKEEYVRSGHGNAEFAKKVKEAEKHVDRLNQQKQRQAHLFKAARSELEKSGITLKNYKQKLEEVNKELKKELEFNEKLAEHNLMADEGSKIHQKGKDQIKTGAVTLAALAVPVKIYMDIEESQADLRKILGEEAEKYYGKLAEISKNNPLSQVEINQIAGSLAQSGIKGEDIVAYTEMAGKMKVAFDISTDEAGTFLAKTRDQLDLSKDELFSYMDTLNMLSNNYSVTAAQLADVSARTGGFAKSINLSKESNMAFATSLISTGVTAEQTSTVLGKLYSELSQGANTKNKAEALKHLGFDPNTINKEMAENAEGTILKVLEKIKNSDVADKSALISDIFGSDKSVINGLSVLSENLDGVKEKLDKAKEAVSENEKVNGEYQDRINTLTNQLKILKNNFVNSLADIGKSVAPELKETVDWLTGIMKSIANFIKENPKLVSFIFKLVAKFALLKIALGSFNYLFGPLLTGLSKLGAFSDVAQKFGFIKAFKKFFPLGGKFVSLMKYIGMVLKTTFITNPVGLFILAIIAVIAIFVLLYKKVEWFRNGVKLVFGGFIEYIKGICKIVVGIFTLNGDMIKEGFHNVVNGIKKIFSGVGLIVKNVWKIVKDNLKTVWDWIKTKFKEIWAKIKEYSVMFIPFVGVFILLYKKCEWFRNGVNAVWIAIKNAFTNTWQWIKDKFNALLEIGSNAWNGLKNSATAIIDKIKEAFSGFFDWINKKWESLKNFGSKLNPFNWFKGDGEVAQNYSGTNYFGGGLTTLAERGAEIVEMGNSSFLVNAETLANLPRGARILNNSQTRSSLSSRVSSLKDRIGSISNDSRTMVGGDTITININGSSGSAHDIAREVKRVFEEMQSKKRRTAIV
nr:MAG TPA: minor tail protein [Caudoviricetes sp.]